MKSTPGPWHAVGQKDVDTGLGYTGNMISITTNREEPHEGAVAGIWNPSGRSEADAHLMAAAPELLEALDTLCAVVGLTAFKHAGQRAVLQEAVDNARAVIAKAKGE